MIEFEDLVDSVHRLQMKDVKDLAETCLMVLFENGYEIAELESDGSFSATKTEVL